LELEGICTDFLDDGLVASCCLDAVSGQTEKMLETIINTNK
jgi:hypothetical protein